MTTLGDQRMLPIEIAPYFRAPSSNGQTLDQDAFRNRVPVVLFFTSGLARADDHAIVTAFDEWLSEFGKLRVQVLGVVPDTPRAVRDHATEHLLAVTLLADEGRHILRAYGGDVEHLPATVVVDRRGRVVAHVEQVSPRHARDVLAEVRRLRDVLPSMHPGTGDDTRRGR